MRSNQLVSVVAIAAGTMTAGPIAAQTITDNHRVEANATESYNLRLCGRTVRVVADGDGDTDLDFDLYDPNGREIHSDYDETDMMVVTVNNTSSCGNYRLKVINRGSVFNAMRLSMQTTSAWSGDQQDRRVALHNHTAESIIEVRYSNTADENYGPNVISSPIRARTNRTIDINDSTGACRFDVQVTTVSGRRYPRRNVDVCSISTLEFGTEISH